MLIYTYMQRNTADRGTQRNNIGQDPLAMFVLFACFQYSNPVSLISHVSLIILISLIKLVSLMHFHNLFVLIYLYSFLYIYVFSFLYFSLIHEIITIHNKYIDCHISKMFPYFTYSFLFFLPREKERKSNRVKPRFPF